MQETQTREGAYQPHPRPTPTALLDIEDAANLKTAEEPAPPNDPVSTRVIRLGDVMRITSLSRSSVYGRMRRGSSQYDASFPRSFRLNGGTGRHGAVGWLEADVLAWARACRASGTAQNPAATGGPNVDVD